MQKVFHEGAVISCINYCAGAETQRAWGLWMAGDLGNERFQRSGRGLTGALLVSQD